MVTTEVDVGSVLASPRLESGISAGAPGAPANDQVNLFKSLMAHDGPVSDSVKGFVEKAQDKLRDSEMSISGKLRQFDAKDDTLQLINAIHESSLRSVSVQFTGKVGSKCAESFEQLLKQQ